MNSHHPMNDGASVPLALFFLTALLFFAFVLAIFSCTPHPEPVVEAPVTPANVVDIGDVTCVRVRAWKPDGRLGEVCFSETDLVPLAELHFARRHSTPPRLPEIQIPEEHFTQPEPRP